MVLPFSVSNDFLIVPVLLDINTKPFILAVAHQVLAIIYPLLRTKKPYTDVGADYFDKLDTTHLQ
jgi:hypothetical protein